ncbi:PaaI family thioesterase [Halalkalibacterium ligniniphilum]|uniref:PaaI family thioesterase n=1 Tax=Halalkalibacterium ligniniphilum TaxID=1134413 RepID=UPI0003452EFB|nr:PaaI family thioesterase [Halalkalibacterium ligniniphilum]
MTDEMLKKKLERFLQKANEEERDVVTSFLDGMLKKQENQYGTYLGALTQIQTNFLDNGNFEVILPIQPIVNNPLNMVHGGITATLLDTAMGSMINRKLDRSLAAVTAEMKVNYLKPGVGTELRCIATVVHEGKHLHVAEAKVFDDKEQLVAMATGTFFIIPRKPAS